MAEWSKAPDSRCISFAQCMCRRVFWSTNVGVGSNPSSDNYFKFYYFFVSSKMDINRKTLRPNIIYRFNFSYRSVGLGIYSLLQSIHSYCDGSLDRSLTVDPLSYFSYDTGQAWYVLSCLWDAAYKVSLVANRRE